MVNESIDNYTCVGLFCNILYPWKLPTIWYKEHMYVIYEHNILAPSEGMTT